MALAATLTCRPALALSTKYIVDGKGSQSYNYYLHDETLGIDLHMYMYNYYFDFLENNNNSARSSQFKQ